MLFFFFFSSNICTRSFTFIRFNINISGGKGGALVRQSRLFSFFFLPFRRFGFNKEGGSANGNVNAERGKRKGWRSGMGRDRDNSSKKKKKMHRDEAKIRELRSLRCFPLFSWFYLDNSCRLREYIFFLKYVCCFFSRCLIMSHFFFFDQPLKLPNTQKSKEVNI